MQDSQVARPGPVNDGNGRDADDDELKAAKSWLGTAASIALVVAALYVGRGVLIPLAIAILLSFLLAPLVNRLRRWRLPKVAAVVIVAAGAFLLIGAFGLLVGAQVTQLATELPDYQSNITAKLRSLREAAPGGGVVDRASRMVQELREELDEGQEAAAESQVPVVRIEEPPLSPIEVIAEVAGPLIGPIGKAGIVVVLVIFILLEREELRNRLIRLLGPNLYVTTEALDEAGQRVSRYLLMQLVVNVTYGIPFGLGLWAIGIPNAFLWAVLAVLLRFIPYLGPVLSAAFPLLLAVAVDPGWTTLLLTVALILSIELVSNNFVEPLLYGSSTSISAVAIIFAAIFWTSLWGPIGLLLSTPVTVCLAVLGRYFPSLAFLDVLLGSAPALSMPERFYQRLLAGDADENVRLAEKYLEEEAKGLLELYDEVVLPALRLAAEDDARRTLPSARRQLVTRSALQVVNEIAEREDADVPEEVEAVEREPRGRVLCAAGRSGLDLVAVTMLAQLLEREGYEVRVVPAQALARAHLDTFDLSAFDAIFLSYLDVRGAQRALRTARRLARRAPRTPIVRGRWMDVEEEREERLPSLVGTADTLTAAVAAVNRVTSKAYARAPIPADEQERLRELEELGDLDARDPELDRFTRGLAERFGVPISLVTLVDTEHQHWVAQTGLPSELAEAGKSPRETSLCGHVVAGNDILVIEDTLADPRFADNPFLLEHGIRFYAGAPLRSASGRALGSVCVIDAAPRKVTEAEKALLADVAREVMSLLEARSRDAARPAPASA